MQPISTRHRIVRLGVIASILGVMLLAGMQLNARSGTTIEQEPGQPLGLPSRPKSEGEISDLLARAQQNGSVRVIVGLNVTNYQPEGRLSTAAASSQRTTIQTTQAALLNNLSAYSVQINASYQILPFIALSVDAPALMQLANSPLVNSIRQDRIMTLFLDESSPLIGADDAWAAGYDGTGQAVAVLDTGVQNDHPFFGGRVVAEACFSLDDPGQEIETLCPNGAEIQIGPDAATPCESGPFCTHGTHVAGIAAGSGPDFSGVARNADIIGIQITSRVPAQYCGGFSPCAVPIESSIISGIEHVYDLRNTYDIAAANLSLGTVVPFERVCQGTAPAQEAAYDLLNSAGIAVVAGSGNGNSLGLGYINAISSPACLPGAISVGATDNSDNLGTFSNSASFLDLLAPGVGINSSVIGSGYGNQDGTSMATPQVAGAIALLRDAVPNATIDEILMALQMTGPHINDSRNGVITPRIQVDAAIDALIAGVPATAEIVINEIQVEGMQAVELYNPDTQAADLSDWTLQLYGGDSGLEHTYIFPTFTLPSDAYVVLYRGSGTNTATELYMGEFTTSWASEGSGAVRLSVNSVGRDFIRWGSSTVMPGAGTGWSGINPVGPSMGDNLGRDAQSTDFDDASEIAAQGPTLGGVNQITPPPNDLFVNAIPITSNALRDVLSTHNATKTEDEPTPDCATTIDHTVWYNFTPEANQTLILQTRGSNFDTALAVYTDIAGSAVQVACHDDITAGSDTASRIVLDANAGTTYTIMVGGVNAARGNLVFTASDGTISDSFDDPRIIDSLPFLDFVTTTEATNDNDDPVLTCGVLNGYQSIWYRYTPTADQTLRFDTTSSNYDTGISVYTGQRASLTEVACADEILVPDVLDVDVMGGTTYHIMIGGGFLSPAGDLGLTVTLLAGDNPTPTPDPSITETPTVNPTTTLDPSITPTVTLTPSVTPTGTLEPGEGDNLVANSGFEDEGDSKKHPEGWTENGLIGAKRLCNKIDRDNGKPDKIVAKVGECAYQLKASGNKVKIKQKFLETGLAGDTLTINAWIEAKNLSAAIVMAKVKYEEDFDADGRRDIDKMILRPGADHDYQLYEQSMTLRGEGRKIVVQVRVNTMATGRMRVDEVNLMHKPSGLLPIPEFRGG